MLQILLPSVVERFEPRTLIGRQRFQHLHEHQRARFVRVRACGFHAVDLAGEHGFVGVVLNQVRKLVLEFLKLLPFLPELGSRRFPNLVDARRLIRREPELLLELLGLPPREGLRLREGGPDASRAREAAARNQRWFPSRSITAASRWPRIVFVIVVKPLKRLVLKEIRCERLMRLGQRRFFLPFPHGGYLTLTLSSLVPQVVES